jgi:hypothetical protein
MTLILDRSLKHASGHVAAYDLSERGRVEGFPFETYYTSTKIMGIAFPIAGGVSVIYLPAHRIISKRWSIVIAVIALLSCVATILVVRAYWKQWFMMFHP